MNPLASSLKTLVRGRSLSPQECCDAVSFMLDGQAAAGAVAAFLTALRFKGPTVDELDGAVAAIRARMVRWDCGDSEGCVIDTCGTGGDGAGTFNISTAAALVVAASGVPVVKHGNRAASGSTGSSDVLSELGVSIDPEPALLSRCLAELKIAFLFAPRFHPGLRAVAPIRRELPFATLFNLVGPLCNPARPAYQLVGTCEPATADLVAEALCRLDHVRRAAVVSGEDGLDEVTLNGTTYACVTESGKTSKTTWAPEDFGLGRHSPQAIRARDAHESADHLRRVLGGERGPARDYVLANSAAALWVARQIPLRDAVREAAAAIDSGGAARLLTSWAALCPQGSG
jgi:anthranilate phosphoribosyltransferase